MFASVGVALKPLTVAALGPGIEREIFWRFLTGPQAAICQVGNPDSQLARVARAIRWIRDHYEQPVPVAELAAIAVMSPTSVCHHVRVLNSMTALEYRKWLRLKETQARLLAGGQDVAG